MKSFMDRIAGRDKSADTAKERLQLLLIHDRTDLPPGMMDDLRDDLVAVISRYMDVDKSAVRIEMEQEGRNQRLFADIPLKSTKPRR